MPTFEDYDGLPYVTGSPPCPFAFDEQPAGWDGYAANCVTGQESLLLFRFTESTDPTIATMCGPQVSSCRMTLDATRYPPGGLPLGVCEGAASAGER